jgi:methenyltetrahydromethanopterin cyclohydrolase
VKDELIAMGRINDALVYGGSSGLWVNHPDDAEVKHTVDGMTFSAQAGADYGKGYAEIYETYECNLFKIPPKLDSPAKVTVTNMLTGSVFVSGKIDEEILYRSFTRRKA